MLKKHPRQSLVSARLKSPCISIDKIWLYTSLICVSISAILAKNWPYRYRQEFADVYRYRQDYRYPVPLLITSGVRAYWYQQKCIGSTLLGSQHYVTCYRKFWTCIVLDISLQPWLAPLRSGNFTPFTGSVSHSEISQIDSTSALCDCSRSHCAMSPTLYKVASVILMAAMKSWQNYTTFINYLP